MNVLLHRPLAPGALERLRAAAPGAEFRHEPAAAGLAAHRDWTEVLYGNPPAALLRDWPRLRWLQIVSSGFDEYAALAGGPVTVTTAHGVHAAPLAQQVLMAMLMFARGQLHFGACQREARWDRNPAVPFRLAGQTVGLVGCGLIARELAAVAGPLGLRLRAVRRSPGPAPDGVERVDGLAGLDDLLAGSDHVVVTLPLTAATRGLLDARRVGLMRNGAYFYNVARGGLVDEAALLVRLADGSLGGAAMDVFATEPLPPDSPWWHARNALVFPHIGGHHRDLGADTLELFADNLARRARGEALRNVADFGRGY